MIKFLGRTLFLIPCFLFLMSFQDQQSEQKRQEELKKLDWLVGQWVDKDEEIDLSFNYSWDEHKNFLINEFKIEKDKQKVLEGKQYITWDPEHNKFRSWLFDSEGGFGQADWKQKGDKWIVFFSQTLPNGDSASAINIYKKINNDSYTFKSVGRMIEGEILPSIDEVTVTRKK
jgi:hypothetical protein